MVTDGFASHRPHQHDPGSSADGARGDAPPAGVNPAWRDFLASLPETLRPLAEAPPPDVTTTADGRTISAEELLAVLTEQVAFDPAAAPRALHPDRGRAGLLAGAWRLVVFGQARAVCLLLERGLRVEALTNARASLEHAVYLRRFAQAVDADQLESFMAEMAYQAHRQRGRELTYLESLDEAVLGPHREFLAHFRAAHEAEDMPRRTQLFDFDQIRRVFEGTPGGAELYNAYGRLSNGAHAGLGSAAPYLLPALQTQTPLLGQPHPVPWAETTALLNWSCWAADDAMTRFLADGADLLDRQIALLTRIGFVRPT